MPGKFTISAGLLPVTALLAGLCVVCCACEVKASGQQAQVADTVDDVSAEDGKDAHNHEPGEEYAASQEQEHGGKHSGEDAHIHRHSIPGQCENIGVAVTIAAETAEKIGLEMARPAARARSDTIELTGRISLNEDLTTHISPRAEGTIKHVEVTLGDEVTEGDLLVLLESVPLREAKATYLSAKATEELHERNLKREQNLYKRKVTLELSSARARYLSAKATADLLQRDYEREKALFEKKISSEKELLEAETAHKKALIDLENVSAELRLIGLDEKEVTKTDWTPDPDRVKPDALSRVITEAQKDLYEAEKEYEKAGIELMSAESRLHLLGLEDYEIGAIRTHGDVLANLPIRAPFGGVIVEKHASVGENVGPNSELFVLADMESLWVHADVYEKDLAKIEEGMEALVACAAYPGRFFRGEVCYVHHIFNEEACKGRLRIEIENPEGRLKPGMFAKVKVNLGGASDTQVLCIPRGAVQTDGTCCSFVFVVTSPNTYESKKVVLGNERGGEIEILSGVTADDEVVVEGGFSLKSEILKSKLGSG